MRSLKNLVWYLAVLVLGAATPAASQPVLASWGWSASAPLSQAVTAQYGHSGFDQGQVQSTFSAPQIAHPHKKTEFVFNYFALAYAKTLWATHGGPASASPDTNGSADLALSWTQNTNSIPAVLSVQYNLSDYPRGTGQGSSQSTEFNWLLSQNRVVKSGDVFLRNPKWQPTLATDALYTFRQTNAALPAALDSLPAMQNLVTNPQNWIVTPQGLQITCGSLGNCNSTALVPWAELSLYLRKGGLAP
jgi:hypothetical protein